MVEGPGCKLKGEKMKGRFRGQTVKAVEGNAVDKSIKKSKKIKTPQDTKPSSPFHELIGRTCIDVQTLGKELFMVFEGIVNCLRVHFLMAGGFRVNGEKLDKDGGGEADTASLILHMSKDDTLRFNKCSVEMRPWLQAKEKISKLITLDICADCFSQKRAVEIMMAQKGRLICDVLLDQEVLPGVGNIIKNEALFDSGIDPLTRVDKLTEAHMSHLVKMTRDFTMIFYKCRKDGTSLHKYLKIYRKGKCGQCGGKVVNTRMGESSERLTSFCANCQTNDLTKLQNRKLPVKNSLIGWVTTPNSSQIKMESSSWTCSLCTLINSGEKSKCGACLAARSASQTIVANQVKIVAKESRTEHNGSFDLLLDLSDLEDKDDDGDLVEEPQPKRIKIDKSISLRTDKYMADASLYKPDGGPQSQTRTSQRRSASLSQGKASLVKKQQQLLTDSQQSAEHTAQIKAPDCPQHGKPTIMREVRKKGPNLKRFFYSCSYSGKCNFFKWADEYFPLCEDHGKRCVLRTVMKQGENNGRRFFACSLDRKKQCQFFTWADQLNNMVLR